MDKFLDDYKHFITHTHYMRFKLISYSTKDNGYKRTSCFKNINSMFTKLESKFNDNDVYSVILVDEHLNVKMWVKSNYKINIPLEVLKQATYYA